MTSRMIGSKGTVLSEHDLRQLRYSSLRLSRLTIIQYSDMLTLKVTDIELCSVHLVPTKLTQAVLDLLCPPL